jgi:hypothetical protein
MITLFGVVASFASLVTVTLAWFQMNRKLLANYGGVEINDLYNVTIVVKQDGELVSDGIIRFDDFFPGEANVRHLEITITNNSDGLLHTSWFFKDATSEQEVPYIDTSGLYGDANYLYYFGSQIQISDVSAVSGSTSVDTGAGEGEYLVETNSVGLSQGQVNGVANAITAFPQLEVLNSFPIEGGVTAEIVFTFLFVDNGTDQSVYSLAWPTAGVCERKLSVFAG